MEVQEISLTKIKHEECLPSSKFVKNIEAVGIRVPVILCRNGHGYLIIDGRRRVQAAINLGLETIPAIIMEDADREIIGLMLNLHRSPNLANEVESLKEYIKAGCTQKEIADLLYIGRNQLKRHFRLLNLCDEGFEMLKTGKLNASTAFELARLSKDTQKEIILNDKVTKKSIHEKKVMDNLSILDFLPVETRNPLEMEFESFIAKLTVGRTLPEGVKEAIETLRRFMKEVI